MVPISWKGTAEAEVKAGRELSPPGSAPNPLKWKCHTLVEVSQGLQAAHHQTPRHRSPRNGEGLEDSGVGARCRRHRDCALQPVVVSWGCWCQYRSQRYHPSALGARSLLPGLCCPLRLLGRLPCLHGHPCVCCCPALPLCPPRACPCPAPVPAPVPALPLYLSLPCPCAHPCLSLPCLVPPLPAPVPAPVPALALPLPRLHLAPAPASSGAAPLQPCPRWRLLCCCSCGIPCSCGDSSCGVQHHPVTST